MDKVSNPHDKLIKEIWSDKKEAQSFLENHLPNDILELINLDSLKIAKDSFIEEDLTDHYSDLLYHVKFEDDPGFIYLLFEHKSFKENLVHLQVFGYMNNIWKLHAKQTEEKKLPIIIPLVLYHGKTKWEIDTSFSSIISGPCEKLKKYIPDFEFILYDLTQYADDDIKGKVLSQIMLFLFKHIHDNDILDKLPGILSLINQLTMKDTGERSIETLLIYLFSTVDINVEDINEIVKKSISEDKGDILMTLAERLRNEGFQIGRQKGRQEGAIEGLIEGIVTAVTVKFGTGTDAKKLIELIKNIEDVDQLKAVNTAVIKAQSIPEMANFLTK